MSDVPDGYTADEWEGMRRCAAALDWDAPPQVVTSAPSYWRDGKGEMQVYFIGAAFGPVKIGQSANPRVRLHQMQAHSPLPLMILASHPATVRPEASYHREFAAHRLHGEWFRRTDEMERLIEQLCLEPATA